MMPGMSAGAALRHGQPWARRLLHLLAVVVGYTAVALWATRPLVDHFADHSPVAYPFTAYDIPMNAWILSWVTHALVTQPHALFDANIYYPARNALAYTEHMLGSIPFFAPGFLATGNPVVALNLMILAGLVLSAVGAYLVTWRWTRSWPAALFAGLVFGFYPDHLHALGPNLQTLQYFPFILLFLDMVLAGGGALPTAGLTGALLGQCLASYYYAYPAVLATATAAAVLCACRRLRPSGRSLLRLGLALAVVAGVLAVVSRPYFAVARGGIETLYGYLRFYARLPTRWRRLATAPLEWLGLPVVALGLSGIALGLRPAADTATRRRTVILAAWVLLGHVLLAGHTLLIGGHLIPMPSRLLTRYAPGFAQLRDRKRLFVIEPAALSILAGMAIAAIAAAVARRRRTLAAVALSGLASVVTVATGDLGPCGLMHLPTREQLPPVYRALASAEPGPVLEVPLGATDRDRVAVTLNTWYEYYSIFHWRPLLNGYASYWPPEFEVVTAMARALPARHALANLVECTGVRWVIAHTSRMSSEQARRWKTNLPGLRLSGRFGEDLLYRVLPTPHGRACKQGLFGGGRRVTLEGTPRVPLPPTARRAMIESVSLPRALRRPLLGVALQARVRVRNVGNARWPAVGPGRKGLVSLSYRWADAQGRVVAGAGRLFTRLPADLRPLEVIEVPLAYQVPRKAGEYQFEVTVEQDGGQPFEVFFLQHHPVSVIVR